PAVRRADADGGPVGVDELVGQIPRHRGWLKVPLLRRAALGFLRAGIGAAHRTGDPQAALPAGKLAEPGDHRAWYPPADGGRHPPRDAAPVAPLARPRPARPRGQSNPQPAVAKP